MLRVYRAFFPVKFPKLQICLLPLHYSRYFPQERQALTPTQSFDPRVDAYIAKSKPFAQPILIHIRELIHKAVPSVVETMKWSRPFFEHKGKILANLSSFKEHCSFSLWGEEISAVLRDAKLLEPGEPSALRRLTTLEDLPSNKQMLSLLRQAVAFIDSGQYTSPIAARQKVAGLPEPPAEVPAEFAKALKANKKASAVFAAFSPSAKREYTEWIAEAKRPETRDNRIATAIEWIGEGKQRHWKYQSC